MLTVILLNANGETVSSFNAETLDEAISTSNTMIRESKGAITAWDIA